MAAGNRFYRGMYTILHWIGSPFHAGYLMWRVRHHTSPGRYIRARIHPDGSAREETSGGVWIHCASTGEVITATPLMERFREVRHEWDITVSVITPWGFAAGKKLRGIHLMYAPLDLAPIPGRWFDTFSPRCFILMETEIWPEMIWSASDRDIPIFIANGRISDQAFRQYMKFRSFFQQVLKHIDVCAVQSDRHAERYEMLGVPGNRIHVSGNLKYESTMFWLTTTRVDLQALRAWKGHSIVLLFASWHREEFPLLYHVVEEIWKKFSSKIHIIIAPRHIEHAGEISDVLREKGIPVCRRTENLYDAPVLILDTQGELAHVYEVSDVTIVGGSYHETLGGHNPIEPAWQGNVILTGPFHRSFDEIIRDFRKHEAVEVVEPSELVQTCETLLRDPQKRKEKGQRAKTCVSQKLNVSRKLVELFLNHTHDK